MNTDRRKQLARAATLIEEAQQLLENAASDERDYYDNMPESIQAGERGERADEIADSLQEAADSLSDICDSLEEARA